MNAKLRGTLCGIIAAVCYGTNPLGALPLYADGINACSVLFYRFTTAVLMLAVLMLVQRKSFAVSGRELMILAGLGILFASSSLSLFFSFYLISAGIASTLLFVYPVMVAIIMAVCFHERITVATVVSIALSLVGIALLYRGDDGSVLNPNGVALVMVSSLTYALYIIIVNKSPLRMSSIKLTLYVLIFAALTVVVTSLFQPTTQLQLLHTPQQWGLAFMLGLLPTVMSLVLMVIAVHDIGSTPTAIIGALEPVTAVVISVALFGELLTVRLVIGILLILGAVMLIVAGKNIHFNSLTRVASPVGKILVKLWRWKQ